MWKDGKIGKTAKGEKDEKGEKDKKGAAKQRKTSQTSQRGTRGVPAFEDIPAGVPLPRNPGSPSSPRKGPRRSASTSRSKPQEPAELKMSPCADKKNEKADKAATQPGEDKERDSPQLKEVPDNSSLQKDQLKPEAKGQPHSAASLLRSSRAKAASQTLPKADAPEKGSTLCGAGPLPPTAMKEDVWTTQPELEDISPALDSLKSSGSERPNLEKPQDSVQVSEQSTLTTLPREVPLPPKECPILVTRNAGTLLPEEVVFKPSRVPVEHLPTEPIVVERTDPGEMPKVSKRLAAQSQEELKNEPTLLSRCHLLAASRRLCEEAQQRAMKQQAALKEAQWREDAVMHELLREQQDLSRHQLHRIEPLAGLQ